MTIYTNENEFEIAHENTCGYSGPWTVISGQYEPEVVECPICRARYSSAQTWFNSEASPEYTENGRKLGSGEYQEREFEGEIPE